MESLGIIGCGNMGEALLKVLSKKSDFLDNIVILEKNPERERYIVKSYNVSSGNSIEEFLESVGIIILAVKPQDISSLLENISNYNIEKKLFISIAAGIPINFIKSKLIKKVKVIRVMPNTPALVGSGISGISLSEEVEEKDKEIALDIFNSVGETVLVEEELIDAITAVSGSGPAYVSFFITSIYQEAIKLGLNEEKAKKIVYVTFKGTVNMLEDTGISPDKLIEKVASPGGTTEAALEFLDQQDVSEVIKNSIRAAYNRSKELSNEG